MKRNNWQSAIGNSQMVIVSLFLAYCLLLIAPSCKNKKATVIGTTVKKEFWTCSMHPEIIRDHPGTCPICGMDLIKKEENATAINDMQKLQEELKDFMSSLATST